VYRLDQTIVAVSSPTGGARTIVRIAGETAIQTCRRIFTPAFGAGRLHSGQVMLDDELGIEAELYLFRAPHSYTGQDMAELHLWTSRAVLDALIEKLLQMGLRPAGPGEFTARAYLNGKIDLSQAEAVNELVVSSNTLQLAAAEKLLAGGLSESTAEIRSAILDCLSLVEAGLDFSGEDIHLITADETIHRLERINAQLEALLAGGISCESLVELPSVGVAGAPNAGKSSLVNRLLGTDRSIVSHEPKTTRDVLTGVLELDHCRCVLFDCAGLVSEPAGLMDELSQQAAIQALRHSRLAVFCVDVSKEDFTEDSAVRRHIETAELIPAATKCDLLDSQALAARLERLKQLWGLEFLPSSSKGPPGVDSLRRAIDQRLLGGSIRPVPGRAPVSGGIDTPLALTARHRQAVTEAIENIGQAISELRTAGDQAAGEIVAMMLRAANQSISAVERTGCGDVDEQVLERIFSRFCIGK